MAVCASSASTPACRPPASAWSTSTGHALAYVASGTITHHAPGPRQPAGAAEGAVRRHRRSHGALSARRRRRSRSSSSTSTRSPRCCSARRAAPASRRWWPATWRSPNTRALQMKQAVAGHGKAAKAQVQEMVKRLLRLPGLPGKDAADALGLAITHAHAARCHRADPACRWRGAQAYRAVQGPAASSECCGCGRRLRAQTLGDTAPQRTQARRQRPLQRHRPSS